MNGREGIGMWIDTAIVLGYILLLVGIGLRGGLAEQVLRGLQGVQAA